MKPPISFLVYAVSGGRALITRGLAMLLAFAALSNPAYVREEREPLPSVAAIVVDRSESMSFGERTAIADKALAELRAELQADPTQMALISYPLWKA